MGKKVKKQLGRSVQTMVKVNLPSDIVESNILTRLPVKTLIRFRAVEKSWHSLISDPFFINMYNQFHKKKKNLLLIEYRHENRIELVIDSCSKAVEHLVSSFNNDTSNFPYKNVSVVGCCNDIVCVFGTIMPNTQLGKKKNNRLFNTAPVRTEYQIILWNPALRINKIVRKYELTWGSPRGLICVGFGYHSQTNDYKVIVFTNDSFALRNVEIYSSTSNSWRKIELGANDLHQLISERYSVVERFGVYVSCCCGGAYFWLSKKRNNGYFGEEDIMISFNMKDEVFKEMMLPYIRDVGIGCSTYALFIYKDSLAALQTIPYAFSCIWVTKEYDDPKSWTNLRKFDLDQPFESFLGIIQTELILLLSAGNHGVKVEVKYDIDKSEMKRKYIGNLTHERWLSFLPQTETVSYFKMKTKQIGNLTLTDARLVSSFNESLSLMN